MTTTPLTDQQLADLRDPLVARLAESTDLRVDQLYAVADLQLPDLAELGRARAELATTQAALAAVRDFADQDQPGLCCSHVQGDLRRLLAASLPARAAA